MMPYIRGGLPVVLNGTATVTPQQFRWREGISNDLYFQNLDTTNDIYLYLTEADKTAGKYVLIPATIGTPGNPFHMALELGELWVASAAATAAFQAVLAVRRG